MNSSQLIHKNALMSKVFLAHRVSLLSVCYCLIATLVSVRCQPRIETFLCLIFVTFCHNSASLEVFFFEFILLVFIELHYINFFLAINWWTNFIY